MKHVVLFSGGVGSWAAAKRVAQQYGTEDLVLLFTDTNMEDEDLYRFIDEAAANVGGTFVRLADGRTPWELFRDRKFIGNTRVDLCSQVLKRDLARSYINNNFAPTHTHIYVGIDWTEEHRYLRMVDRWKPYTVKAPLCEPPLITKKQVFDLLEAEGIRAPRLYDLGFPHNNCGGFCVKAGQAHFKHLLTTMPERYAYHEAQEEELRQVIGKNVAILRDRKGGTTKPLTLKELRRRIQGNEFVDFYDWGGCGCMGDSLEEDEDMNAMLLAEEREMEEALV